MGFGGFSLTVSVGIGSGVAVGVTVGSGVAVGVTVGSGVAVGVGATPFSSSPMHPANSAATTSSDTSNMEFDFMLSIYARYLIVKLLVQSQSLRSMKMFTTMSRRGCKFSMNGTECDVNSMGFSCPALVAAVAEVSHVRFRDARVLFDPIIKNAARIWLQESNIDTSKKFDRLEDVISCFVESMPDPPDITMTKTPGGAIKLVIGNTCPFWCACQIMDDKIGVIEGCAEAITLLQVIDQMWQSSESLTYEFQPSQRRGRPCLIYIGTVEQILLNREHQSLYTH